MHRGLWCRVLSCSLTPDQLFGNLTKDIPELQPHGAPTWCNVDHVRNLGHALSKCDAATLCPKTLQHGMLPSATSTADGAENKRVHLIVFVAYALDVFYRMIQNLHLRNQFPSKDEALRLINVAEPQMQMVFQFVLENVRNDNLSFERFRACSAEEVLMQSAEEEAKPQTNGGLYGKSGHIGHPPGDHSMAARQQRGTDLNAGRKYYMLQKDRTQLIGVLFPNERRCVRSFNDVSPRL